MGDQDVITLGNRYTLQEVIGRGGYGVVASAHDTRTRERVAVKRISRVLETYPMATRILRELKFMRLLGQHENIIKIKDILLPNNHNRFNDTFVVMEIMPCDLHRVIQSDTRLTESNIKFLMFQLLRGIHYMHGAGVLHRDIKPSNLLVDSRCKLKITDFGLARAIFRAENDTDHEMLWTNYVATRWYRAPELIMPRATNYGTPIDMWSAGCILAELILRRALFPGDDSRDQLRRITDFTGKPEINTIQKLKSLRAQEIISALPARGPVDYSKVFPAGTNPLALDLIRGMLEFDPDKRITAAQALNHAYFHEWLHVMGMGPTPSPISEAEFEFEKCLRAGMEDKMIYIRREFLEEILIYHPEKRAELAAPSNYEARNNADAMRTAWDRQERDIRTIQHATSMPRQVIANIVSNVDRTHANMTKMSTMPYTDLAKLDFDGKGSSSGPSGMTD